MRLENRCGEC